MKAVDRSEADQAANPRSIMKASSAGPADAIGQKDAFATLEDSETIRMAYEIH
jgi:hypothetical protein